MLPKIVHQEGQPSAPSSQKRGPTGLRFLFLLSTLTLLIAAQPSGAQALLGSNPPVRAAFDSSGQRVAVAAAVSPSEYQRNPTADSSGTAAVRIRAEVEVRGYYHRAFVRRGQSPLSRGGYFRHRRSRLILESARRQVLWGRLALAAQPEVGESRRVLTGDKRYFGTNLMLDLDEAFVEAALGPARVRFGRQYVQLGLSPDHALVVDDYDFTSDDHADAIHNALRTDVSFSRNLVASGLISRTRQGLDKPYGGDPVPYGSHSLLAAQLVYAAGSANTVALYFAADHNVVDVPCDRWYTGVSSLIARPGQSLYVEVATMRRQRPDGQIDRGWAWYVRFLRRFRLRGKPVQFLFRHVAFSSDNPRTADRDETFLSAFNHFRVGESLDHRKTNGKSVLEFRLGYQVAGSVELTGYVDLRQPFSEHPFVRHLYPKPRYDWTGDEAGLMLTVRRQTGSLWGGISFYQPHTRLYFDKEAERPREVLILLGMNVFIGGH